MSTADKGEEDLELLVPKEYWGLPPPSLSKLLRNEKSSENWVGKSWVNVESLLICSSHRRSGSGDWMMVLSKLVSFPNELVVSDGEEVFCLIL